MGYAIAEVCAEQGADVILISGPVHLETRNPAIKKIPVSTAEEMFQNCVKYFEKSDIAVLSAAVADFTPVEKEEKKIKRAGKKLQINLKSTQDIAAYLGGNKKESQILVGFALETDNEVENAISKRVSKNLDFIVLNSLKDKGAGFGTDTNKITIIDKNNNIDKFELKTKEEVAKDIVDAIIRLI